MVSFEPFLTLPFKPILLPCQLSQFCFPAIKANFKSKQYLFTSRPHQSHLYQGRTSGCPLFLLACIHPVTSCRAGWIFHPSMSSGSFGSSKQATPCIQARIMCAHSFYLCIDDFASTVPLAVNSRTVFTFIPHSVRRFSSSKIRKTIISIIRTKTKLPMCRQKQMFLFFFLPHEYFAPDFIMHELDLLKGVKSYCLNWTIFVRS